MRAVLSPRRQQRPDEAGSRTGSAALAERVFRIRESGIVVVLAVFVAITAAVQPRFLSATNIQFVLVDTTVFALLALGETMVVISRNVDLSVGSVLGLSAYASANLFGPHPGIPDPGGVPGRAGHRPGVRGGQRDHGGRRAGAEPGRDAGHAVHHPRDRHPAVQRQAGRRAARCPNAFLQIPRSTILGIPDVAIAVAVVIGIGAYYLRTYRSGRELYAIGSNPEAARLAGIPVGRRVFTAFADQRRHRRRRRRAVGRAVRDDRLQRRHRLRAPGRIRRGGRRRRDLRRQRQLSSERRWARCCCPPSPQRCTCSASPRSGTRRSGASCSSLAIALDKTITVRLTSALRKRRTRHA